MDFSAFGKTNKSTKQTTKKVKKLDLSAFEKQPKKVEIVEKDLDTKFFEKSAQGNYQSLINLGLKPEDAKKGVQESYGKITPKKTTTSFGGETRLESYYGDETVTPRVSISNKNIIAESDKKKRYDIFGTLKTELDHIISKALGGTDSEKNLKTEEAQRTLIDILKKTPSNELEDYKRQGGRLATEKTIIKMYQDKKINQIQALDMMSQLKDTEIDLVGGSSGLTAIKMAWNKLIGKDPTEGIVTKKTQPSSIKISVPKTQDIFNVIDKPKTPEINVKQIYQLPEIKVNIPTIQKALKVEPIKTPEIKTVTGAKGEEPRATVGQTILKSATSNMILQPVKALLGLSKMATENQTKIVNNSKLYPKFIKEFTSKTNDKINKTLDNLIGGIDKETISLMSGVYKDDGKYDKQEVANLITQGISSLAIAGATGAISGGTTLPAILFGGLQTSDTYLEAKKSGLSTNQATLSAIADGTWTSITEKIGLDFMFGKYLKGSGLGRRIFNTILTETSQELTQQYGSNAIAKLGYDKNRNIFDGTLDTIIATVPTAIIGGGITEVARNQGITQVKRDFANAGVNIDRKDAEKIYDKLIDNVLQERQNFEDDILNEINKRQELEIKTGESKKEPIQKPPVAPQEKIIPETTKVSTEPKTTQIGANLEQKGSIKPLNKNLTFYRETSPSGFDDLFHGRNKYESKFFDTNIDLALGQGENKGIIVKVKEGNKTTISDSKKGGSEKFISNIEKGDIESVIVPEELIKDKKFRISLKNKGFDVYNRQEVNAGVTKTGKYYEIKNNNFSGKNPIQESKPIETDTIDPKNFDNVDDLFKYTPFKEDIKFKNYSNELRKKYGINWMSEANEKEMSKINELAKNNIPAKGNQPPPPVEQFRGTREDIVTGTELFHATTPDRLEQIAKDGLKINSGAREVMSKRGDINPLFFSDDPEHALGFIQDLKNEGLLNENIQGSLLRVRNLPQENLFWDELGKHNSVKSGGSWTFDKNIPAKYIEIKQNGKWQPITDIYNKANQSVEPKVEKPSKDITGFKKTLSKEELSSVERLEDIEYRKVALDKDNKYKPFKISKEDELFYKENFEKYREKVINYISNAKKDKSLYYDNGLLKEGEGTIYDTPEIIAIREAQKNQPSTHLINTPERIALRNKIIKEGYGNGAEIKERVASIVIGPPAAGKSTVFVKRLKLELGALEADSDIWKEKLPEFENGKFAGAVHQESSDINDAIIRKATKNGDNLIIPIIGKNENKVMEIAQELYDNGYEISLYFNDLSEQESAKRAVTRYQETGRFVDPLYIIYSVDGNPKRTFNSIKNNSIFVYYEHYSNDVKKNESPILIEKKQKVEIQDVIEKPRDAFSSWAEEEFGDIKKEDKIDIDKELEDQIKLDIIKEAKQEANMNLERDIKSLGGLKPYKDAFMKEELSSIPFRIKNNNGIFLDELVGELNGMGYMYENSDDLLSDIQNIEKGISTSGAKKISKPRILNIISTTKNRMLGINKPVKPLWKDKDRIRESTAFKKYKESLGIELRGESEYEISNRAENKALAYYFAQENWDLAIKISKGIELPPQQILKNNISEAVINIELAKDNPNIDLINEIITKKSMALTRAGQEIESQSGAYTRDKASFFMEQLLHLKRKYILNINYQKDDVSGKIFKEKFEDKVSKRASEIRKKMDLRTAKLKKAEDIINSIIC